MTFEVMTQDLDNFFKGLVLARSSDKRIISHKNNHVKVLMQSIKTFALEVKQADP